MYNASIAKYFGGRETALLKKEQKTCLDSALGYLTFCMRSEHEMQSHLVCCGYTEDEIERTMHRLRELGYIDDVQLTHELIRTKTAVRPVGRKSLSQTLRRKGISGENIELGLSGYSQEEEQKACNDLFYKLALKHGTDRAGLAKIQRALVYRGFGYDMIQQAAEHERGKDETV